MSRHPSLKATGKIRKKRNVLKKFERVNLLTADGRWKQGQKVLSGLPKTKPLDRKSNRLESETGRISHDSPVFFSKNFNLMEIKNGKEYRHPEDSQESHRFRQ